MEYKDIAGVPEFESCEFEGRKTKYCLIIPVLNEENNIFSELQRAIGSGVHELCDIIICDGNSTDKTNNHDLLKEHKVNTLLIKKSAGKQGAQLRMGFWWAINRGYEGVITIDGNNKDGIERTADFIKKLDENYDFVQGSRFISGGEAINTPFVRKVSVKLVHSPIISLAARKRYTDSTNNFRAYSIKYLTHEKTEIFRDIFNTYELLAYLSVRASRLGLKCCEIPVRREYPPKGKIPTKISFFRGNLLLLSILLKTLFGLYNPPAEVRKIRKRIAAVFLSIFLLACIGCGLSYSNSNNHIIIRVSDHQEKVLDTDDKQKYEARVYCDNSLFNTVEFYANKDVSIAEITQKVKHSNFEIVIVSDDEFVVEKLVYINKNSKKTDLKNAKYYEKDFFDDNGIINANGTITNNSSILVLSPKNFSISKNEINNSFLPQNFWFYFCSAAAFVSVLLFLGNFSKAFKKNTEDNHESNID